MRISKNITKYVLVLICVAFSFTSSFSQIGLSQFDKITRYTAKEGLPSTYSLDIKEDNYGFLWIATGNGVTRFDGSHFLNYEHYYENSVAHKIGFVNSLKIDKSGKNIWISTSSGVFSTLIDSVRFERKYGLNIKNKRVNDLLIDYQNNVWSASTNGLVRLNEHDTGNDVFVFKEDYKLNQLQCLVRDTENPAILWIGTLGGLVKFNLNSRAHQSYVFGDTIDLSQNRIRKIAVSKDEVFLGTWTAGLVIFNKESQEFKQPLKKQYPNAHQLILGLYNDNDNGLWVTSDNGIIQYDISSNQVKKIQNHHFENNIMRGISFIDSRNIIWFGYKHGLFKYQPKSGKNKFITLEKRTELQVPLLTREIINSGQYIYLGGQHSEGLYKIDKHSNTIKTIKIPFFDYSKDKGYHVMDMVMMHDGNILVLSGSKIVIFNPITERFSLPPLQIDHVSPAFQTVVKDKTNRYWIGSREGGLYCLDYEKGTIKNYKEEFNTYRNGNHRWINNLYIDSENKLWIGKGSTGALLDLDDLSIHVFDPKNTSKIKSYPDVEEFYEDREKRMWIAGGSHGIGYVAIRNFNKGITHKIDGDFSGIYKHNDSLLWTTGKAGLGELNTNTLTHKKIKLSIDEKTLTVKGPIFNNANENYIIGSNNGLIIYDPIKEDIRYEIPQPYIRKISSGGKMLYEGNELKNNELHFGSKTDNLILSISSLGFQQSEQTTYQYKIQDDWVDVATNKEINITNLTSGDYSFQIKACNSIGNCNALPVAYNFTILTAWYKQWWAYTFYGFVLLSILVLLYRFNLNKKLAIAEQQKTLELDSLKSEMYANISHEFRTPLTVILGMVDALKSSQDNQNSKNTAKSLDMIHRNGENLLHLVNELLDLAKLENGSMELSLIQTDVVPFVKYVSESFHSLAESKKINLTVYSETDTLEMDIDVNKVASVISNLLSNAIKFTPNNGKIIVHLNKITSNGNAFFILKVQDNGMGLLKEDVVHLFDRFYQVNGTVTKQDGTGIGLSLTKQFVELMDGTIAVESVFGKGSTFTVKIPVTNGAIKTEEAKITRARPLTIPPLALKKEILSEASDSILPLVLIIEDNEDVACYLETSLKTKYQTIHALDGNAGLSMAFKNIPDIIISDVMMPGKDGFEVCATLKADERTDHIPIILLTARVTTEDRLAGLTHGADAYLAKPFHQEELFTRLDQLILVRKKLIHKLEKNGLSSLLKEKVDNPQTKFLKQVIQCIHAHLDDTNFGPTQLAKEMHLSESQTYRKLKAITDKSTAIFIRSVRLQKAKELIETTDMAISEIAYLVGFSDPSWFSRAFKKEFDLAPSDIIK